MMKSMYDPKFIIAVSSVTILLALFLVWSYMKGWTVSAILTTLLTLWGCAVVLGHLRAPRYLEQRIVQLIKNNGGRIEYKRIIDSFRGTSKDPERDEELAEKAATKILEKLENKRKVKLMEGIVHMIEKPDSGHITKG